ncbi:MAG: hypothetical protein WC073_04565 [Sterolibacterium sp.]
MFLKINRPVGSCLVAASLCLLALPCHAAKKKPEPVPFNGDLTTPAVKHGVECPLPKQRPCVIKKPVGTGYRVITAGVTLEDMGEYWLADLTKLKDPKSNRAWMQIWAANGDLHEIEILFPKEPLAKQVNPPKKEAEPVKEEEKKATE